MHHYTLSDIAGSVTAVAIFPLFALAPGYAIAWLLDLFDFRRRTAPFRLALSLPLSIAAAPIAAYLTGRFAGMTAVWGLFALAWIYAAFVIWKSGWGGWPRQPGNRALLLLAAGWAALAVFSLCDLQIGNRLYYSTMAFDYSVRAEFIHAIGVTGIPPANPFFFPGRAEPMRYHYFWLIPCSLVELAAPRLVAAREAWIGGAVWCGFGLMAIVALFLRLFFYRGEETLRRRIAIGILLMGVTGLDILPTALSWLMYVKGRIDTIPPTVEWWNEQVDGFTWTALWEAHYVAGFVTVLLAFLLITEAAKRPGAGRWRHAAVAGVALACAFGEAIYIALVFGIFLLVWTGVALLRKWRAETGILILAGVLSLLLAAPYLAGVAGGSSGAGGGGGGFPFRFELRSFWMVDHFLMAIGRGEPWRLTLVNAALLPLNYLLELGFFGGAALAWWRMRRARGEPLTRNELAAAVMALASVGICTFFRSTAVDNNDLGWRGFLPAQFALLLWSVDIAADWKRCGSAALAVMLALGAAGTVYDVAILRVYPMLCDAGVLPPLKWMAPDRQMGERTYAEREAYEWARQSAPESAVLQFDPHVAYQNTTAFLYSERQVAAADEQCLTGFGGDAQLCPPLLAGVKRLYPDKGAAAPARISPACAVLPAKLLAVKDTDPVWSDRASWVWREQPVFANRYVRLFECGVTPAQATPAPAAARLFIP